MDIKEACELLTKEIPKERVLFNEPMYKHTTFKVGGNADIFVIIKNTEELKFVIKISKNNNIHLTIIGNGSNVLVKDEGIRGIVAKVEIEDIDILENENEVIVTAGAGVKLITLAYELLKRGISGFEFASGIPGTIGGAIKMNAGAYGTEMKDIVISTQCLDLQKFNTDEEIVEFTNEEQKFKYRDSIFSNRRYIILETKLKLKYDDENNIKEKMDKYLKSRKDSQPDLPSAGSTFKRGEDYITAKLIDECGLKGYRIGDAEVSDKHAGFIVNTGNASAQDILELIEHVKKVVFEKTGKCIKLEVEILGE